MSDHGEDKSFHSDEREVVERLLTEIGLDEATMQELIASGRLKGDVFKIESPEDVRRRMEISKSVDRLRDSLNLLERNLLTVDGVVDRIERDLLPVVLSFLVGLKGRLVNLRGLIITKSKKRAKTNLQAAFIESDVQSVINEEFTPIEESLTAQMATPILDKTRDITDGLRDALKVSFAELSTLKVSVDDLVQRTTTEVEAMSRALSMKPKVEVPKETQDKILQLERQIEEMRRDLSLAEQKIQNRDKDIESLRAALATEKERARSLEETVSALRAMPTADVSVMAELRQSIKALEATRDLLTQKLEDTTKQLEAAERKASDALSTIAARDVEIDELRNRLRQTEAELTRTRERDAMMDELRARLRSYESGDTKRELDRLSAELERVTATLDRLTREHDITLVQLKRTETKLKGYLSLMDNTEKTKAFLMVEEAGELPVREISRSLGISPGQVLKWAEDFQRLGIARLTENDTIILTLGREDTTTSVS